MFSIKTERHTNVEDPASATSLRGKGFDLQRQGNVAAVAGGKQEEALFSAALRPQVAEKSVEWFGRKKKIGDLKKRGGGGKRKNLADEADYGGE